MGRFYYGACQSVKDIAESQSESGKLMYDSVEAFLHELEELKQELFPIARLEIVYSRFNKASIRMLIDANFLVNMYFYAENGRCDLPLIKAGRRIFGYDNLGKWHYHPVDNPADHVNCDASAMRQVLEEMAAIMQSQRET